MTMTLDEAADVATALFKAQISDAVRGEILFYLNSCDHLPYVWVQRSQNIQFYAMRDVVGFVGRDNP